MEASSGSETAVLQVPPPISFEHVFPYNVALPTSLAVPGFAAKSQQDERQRLVQQYTGETIQVENLIKLMPAWFKKILPQQMLDEVNVVIDEWLKTCVTPCLLFDGGS